MQVDLALRLFFRFESKSRSDDDGVAIYLPSMIDGVSDMSDDQRPFATEAIRYGYRPTTTGLAAIAVSRRGVAAVLLGTARNGLRQKLADALSGADLIEDENAIGPMLTRVARQVGNPADETGFDLDMRGDARELAVWAALRAIPIGGTRTYGALAKAIGTGLTARDVGAACADNRLAVIIPCHRVVKADGSVSGYRWGVHRKRKLLAMEKAI